MAGRQRSRGYGLSKNAAGSFTAAIQYSKSLNLLAICWSRSEHLSYVNSWLLWMLLLLLAERAGRGLWRRKATRAQVKVRSGMKALVI